MAKSLPNQHRVHTNPKPSPKRSAKDEDRRQEDELVKRSFGAAVRLFRNHVARSQESWALESERNPTYFQQLEYGASAPTVITIFRLSRVIHVRPAGLVALTEKCLCAVTDAAADPPAQQVAAIFSDYKLDRAPAEGPNGSIVAQALGIAVRVVRSFTRQNQETLAARAGLDRSYQGSIERGESSPTLPIVFRLAKALRLASPCLIDASDVLVQANLRQAALQSWLDPFKWTAWTSERWSVGEVLAMDLEGAIDAAHERWPAHSAVLKVTRKPPTTADTGSDATSY